ncbi:acylphosphatase [Marinilactibacillus piezotolerans]|uniref:acylphosphatase n=1 Tax=Marinilactibacillus piezotolerans TaxID=258723 RepID=UPI0009AF4560
MGSLFDSFLNKGKQNKQPAPVDYLNERNPHTDQDKISAQVYGHVQGVGFRMSTKQAADEIGVTGIVRNESDGSVYAEAVGSSEQIDQFIEVLRKGPSPAASVDKVVIKFDEKIEEKSNFSQAN